ncbi:ATP-binding protein [Faecalispora anaeroviscerum]|uniref:ATP-binding protein n=1 Tax=Faecalispora anaeroviscerum TaxID=2991836 RepID=UPI0024BA78FF|nr:ATP-binding protein [Faecalispora anaeroviscerum]
MSHKNQIKTVLLHLFIVLVLLLSAAGIGYLLRDFGLPEANIVIVFFLAVLLTSLLISSYVVAIFTSVLAAFLFNFLFTEPYFSFSLNAPSYITTLFFMSIAALLTSMVTFHAKQNERNAKERELESRALYALTNLLTDAKTFPEIAELAADTISKSVCAGAACLCFDENGEPEDFYVQCMPGHPIRRRTEDVPRILQSLSDLDAGYVAGPVFYDWPIYAKDSILGLIRLPREKAQRLSPAQIRILRSMIESTALAMDRFLSSQQRIRLHEETVQERYRVNLLRAISHDLRTPLAGMMGTSEMLLGMTDSADPRRPLMEGIYKDAGWLHSLVENILSLTRLQDGMLAISKQMEAAEEILGGAARYVMRHHPGYDIEVHAPDELFLVPMDAKLISQVLINLLENAVKHTDSPGEICVSVEEDKENQKAVFSVRDRGSGIGNSDLPHIFELFYTSHAKESDSRKGVGLGLAICDTIVKAHGGSIWAHNRTDGSGAEFVFNLPLEVKDHE